MSKFVGKFRKNRDYNDDYKFSAEKRKKNEHAELKKIKNYTYDSLLDTFDNEIYDKRKEKRVL